MDISNDGDNEGSTSNQEHLEDSVIGCFGKTIEPLSSPSFNHQSEGAVVTECDDKVSVDGDHGALLNRGSHNKDGGVDDSVKKISMLDQLRQIPLSSVPTTRKRARDALLTSSVIKKTSSRRRSRSSLGNNSCESQKPTMLADAKLNVGSSACIVLLEELSPKKEVVVKGENLATCSAEASPISSRVPIKDNLAVKTDGMSLEDGNTLEFSVKVECSDNDAVSNTFPEKDSRLSSKTEIPLNTLEIKAESKPYIKQLTSGKPCDEMDKEFSVQAEGGSFSDSLNSLNGATDKFNSADGDEHLPLVKRARVRMGKQSVKEENLKESSNGHYESASFASPVKNCPLPNGSPKRTSPDAKEFASSLTNGPAHKNTGSDLSSCKLNKYLLMLDVEAALPPSKRLHRALEAMSANAAEAAIGCPEAPSKAEIKSSDCLGSLSENVQSDDERNRFLVKPLPLQASVAAEFDRNACRSSSRSPSQNLVDSCLCSSEAKHDDSNLGNAPNSLKKNCVEIVTGRSCHHGPFISKITGVLKQSSSLEKQCGEHGSKHSCSSAVDENDRSLLDKNCAYSEGVRVSPRPNGTSIFQQLNCFSSSSGIDGTGGGSDSINVDSAASDLNGIPSVSSASNVSSATNVYSLVGDMDRVSAASVMTNFSSTVNCTLMATLSRSQIEQTSRVRDM